MKRIYPLLIGVLSFGVLSCEKKETPYPIPDRPASSDSMKEAMVELGADYKTQVYFSFENGVVKSLPYETWDINFTTDASDNELRVNGGKLNLIYVTDATRMSEISSSYTINSAKWKYDKPSGLSQTSGLGVLNNSAILGKVLIVQVGADKSYKLIIKDVSPTAYTIATTKGLDDNTETEFVLEKDPNYNFIYFSFEDGIVTVEPPKKDWDIVFTRYRYIYEKYNPDGSDFLYGVTGVLHNPYNTMSAGDSLRTHDFYTFTKDSLDQHMELQTNRDVIGWNWKSVDINTAKYKVNSKMVYVVKDQKDILWKLHFYGYTNDAGQNGYPKFRYEKLK